MQDIVEKYLNVISESSSEIELHIDIGAEFLDEDDERRAAKLFEEFHCKDEDEQMPHSKLYIKKQPVKICDLNMRKFFSMYEMPYTNMMYERPNVSEIDLIANVYVMGAYICFTPIECDDEDDNNSIHEVEADVRPLIAFCFNKDYIRNDVEWSPLTDNLTLDFNYNDYPLHGHRLLYDASQFPAYAFIESFHPLRLETAFIRIGNVYAWYWASDYVDYKFEKDISGNNPDILYNVVKETLKEHTKI
jgi:hypothetical protein